jgi:hypothetical protein
MLTAPIVWKKSFNLTNPAILLHFSGIAAAKKSTLV